mmetsp:Transcript_48416/g.149579  ORF Transcript_48416/g.149579 Transcript_48416/m.149579 type:complete len:421 (+) Transcript_48416:99-1361(+)|eukprot:CAMPEP_0204601530 /NCGR_PEP_ID=MMETSP0661-20131031/56080_1 /ASSEMBLY_ACC=CAM_ASM_000606 /TAXON_ID=109239 /ORGANISM="Alexandrium margalefi, Strain AMGDE01CS-322" /LENGTH=420 /DNA_ID=CAMNT_0051612411 /DNA_START=88 /DNA_END=1350 /DNA_ORIENTATION=-
MPIDAMAPCAALVGLAALCSRGALGMALSHAPDRAYLQPRHARARRLQDLLDSQELQRSLFGGAAAAPGQPASDLMSVPLRSLVSAEMVRQYADRPPEERWQELLDRATSTPEDPCDADVLSTYGWNAGFGSGVNIFMAEVAVAAYFGRTVARCHAPDQNIFSFLFLWQHSVRLCNRSELCTDTRQYLYDDEKRTPWGYSAIFWGGCLNSLECELNHTGRTPWLKPSQRHPGISPEFRAWSKRFRHFIYDSVFRIVPTQREKVESWVQQWGPPAGQPYIGVHLRGTDKYTEAPNVSLPLFVEKISAAAAQAETSLVFIASDDQPLAEELAAQLKAALPGAVPLMKPKGEYPVKNGGHPLRREEKTALLGELQVLRNSTIFIGTASSNVGRLVYFLREPQEGDDTLSISMDEDGDWFSRFC